MLFVAKNLGEIAAMFARFAENEEKWAGMASSARDRQRCEIRAATFRECETILKDTEIRP